MAYTIYPGDDFKQSDGTALVNSEIELLKGRVKGLGTSQSLVNNLAAGKTLGSLYGSIVMDNSNADKIIDAGNFAGTLASIIKRVTTSLAGVAYTNLVLTSGAASWGQRRSINQVVSIRTVKTATAIVAGYWNITTGKFSSGPDVANDFSTFVTQAGDGGGNSKDEAANPSRAKPGELVYLVGNLNEPTQADYSAKTGG